jgi:hypothetical protein
VAELDALAAGFLAAWSDRAFGAFAGVCSPSVHYEDPMTDEPLVGPAALAEHAGHLRTGLPDARLHPTGACPNDDRYVAIPARLSGTHTGTLAGLPPTRRSLSLHCVFFCELDRPVDVAADGPAGRRLHRIRAFFDVYDAGTQLRLLPARGTLGGRALLMLRGFGLRARD